jgi:hypothetical protein
MADGGPIRPATDMALYLASKQQVSEVGRIYDTAIRSNQDGALSETDLETARNDGNIPDWRLTRHD